MPLTKLLLPISRNKNNAFRIRAINRGSTQRKN